MKRQEDKKMQNINRNNNSGVAQAVAVLGRVLFKGCFIDIQGVKSSPYFQMR